MGDRLNILFVETGAFGGGSFESLYSLLRRINRQRYNPIVMFLNHTKYLERFRSLGIDCRLVRDPLYTIKGNSTLRASRFLNMLFGDYLTRLSVVWEYMIHKRALKCLKQVVEREHIDIVHTNDNINRDFFCLLTNNSYRAKTISHLRSFTVEGFNCKKATLANRRVEKFIAVTGAVKDLWASKGLNQQKIAVVHNGIEPVDPTPVEVKRRLGLTADCWLSGAVGSYNADRGYENLLRAFSILAQSSDRYRLLFIGPGNKNRLGPLVRDLGIGNLVHFIDQVDEAVSYIKELDALVMPYEVEPFGRTLLEAWLVKTPVVLTEVGRIREMVGGYKNCLMVKYGDLRGLADAIEGMDKDRERTKALTESGYRFVHQQYHIKKHVKEIEEIYEQLAVSGGEEKRRF